jgi:hypothetical protein
MVRARESKVCKSKLLDATQARHLWCVDNDVLEFTEVNTTIDRVDDEGHEILYEGEGY